jgi:hypothetical protein
VVQDNLNTHTPASLYQAFEPSEARRIMNRLEFCYTPKHGSWLNMAEIELSVLSRQCHNSQDKAEVIEIAQQLQKRGLKPWLDVWELRPGLSWQELLEEQIAQIKSAAVFIGSSGLGPWQKREMRAFLSEFVDRNCPVVPVLLKSAPQKPKLPIFLKSMTWCDFKSEYSDPMEQLIWGITGIKPESPISPAFPSLQVFKFDVVTVKLQNSRKVQHSGLFGLKEEIKISSIVKINSSPSQAQYFSEDLGMGVTLDMVYIPGGKFLMGTEDEEIERLCKKYNTENFRSEQPQHEVTVQPFFMGKDPITQEQWRVIAYREDLKVEQDLNPNPTAYFEGRSDDYHPIRHVAWSDIVLYQV